MYPVTPEQLRERDAAQQIYNIWRSDKTRPCPIEIIKILATFSKESAHRVVIRASDKGIKLNDIYPCEVSGLRSIDVGKVVTSTEEYINAKKEREEQLLEPWYNKIPFKLVVGSAIALVSIGTYLTLKDR